MMVLIIVLVSTTEVPGVRRVRGQQRGSLAVSAECSARRAFSTSW